MKRQPRNPKSDKLVNERLISMAYGQIGSSTCARGLLWSGSYDNKHHRQRTLNIEIYQKMLFRYVHLGKIGPEVSGRTTQSPSLYF